MKKSSLIAVGVTLAAIAMGGMLVSCSGKSKSAASGNVIHVQVGPSPETIDPALNSAVDGATIISHCFAGLYRWAQVNGALTLEPDCATGYTKTEEDGKTVYTFTLRDGLKWSDGTELKASDFAKP